VLEKEHTRQTNVTKGERTSSCVNCAILPLLTLLENQGIEAKCTKTLLEYGVDHESSSLSILNRFSLFLVHNNAKPTSSDASTLKPNTYCYAPKLVEINSQQFPKLVSISQISCSLIITP
jgi:hypothetical protein